MMQTTKRVRDWFDLAEAALEHESRQAGLLEHAPSVGAAREFLVKRVLRTILPPYVHIGTGRVQDGNGNVSSQIDVLVVDPRFPPFEIESGIGLYLLESVIASIEVKSTLTTTSLRSALDNGRSLLRLSPYVEDPESWKRRAAEHSESSADEALRQRRIGFALAPATYIFSFTSKLGKASLCKHVGRWFEKNDLPTINAGYCAVLPRIIVAGKTIGVLDDGLQLVDPGSDVMAEWARTHVDRPRHILGHWDTERRFGWFASHLLQTVCRRIGLVHGVFEEKYAVQQYFAVQDYFEEDLRGREGSLQPLVEIPVRMKPVKT